VVTKLKKDKNKKINFFFFFSSIVLSCVCVSQRCARGNSFRFFLFFSSLPLRLLFKKMWREHAIRFEFVIFSNLKNDVRGIAQHRYTCCKHFLILFSTKMFRVEK
jgi:hypothetical protein